MAADRDKAELRERARARRAVRVAPTMGIALAAALAEFAPYAEATCVAAYAALPSEPDLSPALEILRAKGVTVLLPVVQGPVREHGPDWARYRGPALLTAGRPLAPPRPLGARLGMEAVREADLILVPALAVDRSGTRLGQGGGWYDRALVAARPDAVALAVVHADELLPAGSLPREEHDVPVAGALSEAGVELF